MKINKRKIFDLLPEFKNYQDFHVDQPNIRTIHITEKLKCDRLDLYIDRNTNTSFMQVNGCITGEEYKRVINLFNDQIDVKGFVSSFSIDKAILSFYVSPQFSSPRVFSIYIIESEQGSNLNRFMPFETLPSFCQGLSVGYMPSIYSGALSMGKIKDSMDRNIMGVPSDGLLVINSNRPGSYYWFNDQNININQKRKENPNLSIELANEFVNLALGTYNLKKIMEDSPDENRGKFLQIILNKTESSGLLPEYSSRISNECGLNEFSSRDLIEKQLMVEINKYSSATK